MKIFLRILFWFGIVLLVIAGVGFLLPSTAHVERSNTINSTPQVVYGFLSDLHNWNKWSSWYEQDTAATYSYEGPEKGVDSKLNWDSKKMGKGSIKISEVVPNQMVKLDLNFMEKGTAVSTQKIEAAPTGGTTVTWLFDADMGANPLMRIMAKLFINGAVGKDYEKGLTKMKTVIESLPPVPQGEMRVEEVTHPALNYLAVRDTATMTNISAKIAKGYGMIGVVMKKQKLNFAAAPFAIYYSKPPVFDFDAAIAVDRPGTDDGPVKAGMMKAGPAVVCHYFGPYDKMEAPYNALYEWMKQHGKQPTGPPWEVYVTDPGTQKDTSKWQTDIYFPL